MRVLHIVHQFAPDFVGGTELNTAGLAREQVKRGHEVAIFVPSPDEPVGGQLFTVTDEPCGRVFRVPVGKRSGGDVFRTTLANSGPIGDAFAQVLADFRPEIVHIQHLMGLPVRAISAQLERLTVPIVVTLHDFWWVCANAQLLTNDTQETCDGPSRMFTNCGRCAAARAGQSELLAPAIGPVMAFRNRWLRPLLERADAVIASTQFVANWYGSRLTFKHPVHIVPVGFEKITGREAPSAKIRDSGDGVLRLVYVGGLNRQKGVHVIVEAIKGIDSPIQLTIGGDETQFPDYVAELKRSADGRVTFAGRLTPAQVAQLMGRSDLLLVPSLWYETYSIVVSEAYAAGIPVMVSDLGALAERVIEGRTGVKVAAGDVQGWRSAIQMIAEQPEKLDFYRNNRPEPFTFADHSAAVEQLYKKLAS